MTSPSHLHPHPLLLSGGVEVPDWIRSRIMRRKDGRPAGCRAVAIPPLAVTLLASLMLLLPPASESLGAAEDVATPGPVEPYHFDGAMSRDVLERYLSRAICMEGLFNGRGDLADNVRMLHEIGAKYIARSLCLWG